jgi:putative Holliday junction resolvase
MNGRRLALDFGLSRIGVAVSDPDGKFAFPGAVLDANTWESDFKEILIEYEPSVIYIGYPLNLSGDAGSSARLAREFALEVASLFSGPVRLIDERLTTKSAMSAMRDNGKSERQGRAEIDAAAATIILESALQSERAIDGLAGSGL